MRAARAVVEALRLLAIGAAFGLLVAVCIGLSVRLAHAAALPEYFVHTSPQRQAALFVGVDSRQWFSEWISDGTAAAMWRNPTTGASTGVEHWSVRDGWLTIAGFSNEFGAVQWPADCVRAEITDLGSGATASITCKPGGGHFYVPFLLPRDPWRIRIWGVIANSLRFYWEAQFTPNQTATDPCYYSGPITRDVIVQREVWFDTGGGGPRHDGWAEGSGTPPFDAAGNPIVPTVTYGVETSIAKGEGVMLHRDLTTGIGMCLYSRWTW